MLDSGDDDSELDDNDRNDDGDDGDNSVLDDDDSDFDDFALCHLVLDNAVLVDVFEAVFIANVMLFGVRLAKRVEIVRKKSSAMSE